MNKVVSILLLLMCSVTISSAQQNTLSLDELLRLNPSSYIYQGKYCSTVPGRVMHANILKKRIVGESDLRVTYEVSVVRDTATGIRCKDRMICQMGDGWYKSYGESLWKSNMECFPPKGGKGKDDYKQESGYYDMITEVVYRDLEGEAITTKGQMPYMRDKVFSYVEPLPVFNWQLSDETKEVMGYVCQKAEASFRGRLWTVWFTTEIPVDCGLWKFSGLPGLILEAADDRGDYEFTASKVEQAEEPIYEELPNEKKMTREEYRELEKRMYDDPLTYVGQEYTLASPKFSNMTGHEIFTPGHYRLLYIPMELE